MSAVVDLLVLAALGIGVALFVASSSLSLWRLGGPVLVIRLAALGVMGVALVVISAISPPPVVPLGTVAVVLFGIVLLEAVAPPDPHRA